jgi:hypothetical protein
MIICLLVSIAWSKSVVTLALGSRPRQKGLQGCRPRGSPGVTPQPPGNVGKSEGMNSHIPKATPTLGDGVPVESRIFRGVKTQWLEEFLISWKRFWNLNV